MLLKILAILLSILSLSPTVTAEELLTQANNVSSWTLEVEEYMIYKGESDCTKYFFEQDSDMIHLVTTPELLVCDGDYDHYFDVNEGVLYSTSFGDWIAEYEPYYSTKLDALISVNWLVALDSPTVVEREGYYEVSGDCAAMLVDALTYDIFDESAEKTIKLTFDKDSRELTGITVTADAGELAMIIDISVSAINATKVVLPFDSSVVVVSD